MTELLIKADPKIVEKFKKISREIFKGDETQTFHEAILALISSQRKKDTSRLRATIDKIRSDIKSAGGLTGIQIDRLVRESRTRRKAKST